MIRMFLKCFVPPRFGAMFLSDCACELIATLRSELRRNRCMSGQPAPRPAAAGDDAKCDDYLATYSKLYSAPESGGAARSFGATSVAGIGHAMPMAGSA